MREKGDDVSEQQNLQMVRGDVSGLWSR